MQRQFHLVDLDVEVRHDRDGLLPFEPLAPGVRRVLVGPGQVPDHLALRGVPELVEDARPQALQPGAFLCEQLPGDGLVHRFLRSGHPERHMWRGRWRNESRLPGSAARRPR